MPAWGLQTARVHAPEASAHRAGTSTLQNRYPSQPRSTSHARQPSTGSFIALLASAPVSRAVGIASTSSGAP